MPRVIDLTGQRFGRWVVLRKAAKRGPATYWACRCDCGNEADVVAGNLRGGLTRSCGCLKADTQASRTHGESAKENGRSGSVEWRTWRNIKQRCLNPRNPNYCRYGAAGITVCKEWIDSFESFLRDVGRKPSDKDSLDRIDGALGYQPGNVRWATIKEQNRNQKKNVFLEIDGERKTMGEWAEITGRDQRTIRERIVTQKLSPKEAVFGELRRWPKRVA